MSMPENLLILPSFLLLFTHGTLNLVCEKASFPSLARVDKKVKAFIEAQQKMAWLLHNNIFLLRVASSVNKIKPKIKSLSSKTVTINFMTL